MAGAQPEEEAGAELRVFFNFRSPYCYLASKQLFALCEDFAVRLLWRPLAGWQGRSPPERAKTKLPLARQDVGRFARRMGIPYVPPPVTTDPTRAGAASLFAEERGLLRPYVVAAMHWEWGLGRDIGDPEVLAEVAAASGLDPQQLLAAADDPARRSQLEQNWKEAERCGVIGVPSFVVGEEIFWGNDRIDFLRDHLRELRLTKY